MSSVPTVTVCRGCCCGTAKKHPDTDHPALLDRLRTALAEVARVQVVTDCLGSCENSNVMVVTPSRVARIFGARPTWLGRILDNDDVDSLACWLAAGGPGVAEAPPNLRASVFPRPPSAP